MTKLIFLIVVIIILIIYVIVKLNTIITKTALIPDIIPYNYYNSGITGWTPSTSFGRDICPEADIPEACIFINKIDAEDKCNAIHNSGIGDCVGYWMRNGSWVNYPNNRVCQLTNTMSRTDDSNEGILYLRK
jgi:hypothetical protein